ncbi:adenylate kinase [Myxococcota bacterium]
MKLVLLGPPASGKGTQADVLCQRYGVPKISTGDMLRAAKAKGTPLGVEADRYMSAGKLVPDEVVIGLVDERVQLPDAEAGFILDGFPRTVPQAESLGQLLGKRGRALDAVVQIDVPRELLMERATLRRMDKRTGQIYHLKYNPPPPEAELVHRADDQEETVTKRLNEYDSMTAALLPYYEKLGVLRRVDGVGPPGEVTERLTAVLRS